jgi:hypothetical protein
LFNAVTVFLQIGYELLEILGREILARHHHRRRVRGETNRRKIPGRVVFQIGVERRCRNVRAHTGGKQRIAVMFGGGCTRGTNRAASAADIFDDDILTEYLAHAVSHDTRNDVARTARRIRNNHGDWMSRIILRLRDSGQRSQRDQRRDYSLHFILPVLFAAYCMCASFIRRPVPLSRSLAFSCPGSPSVLFPALPAAR